MSMPHALGVQTLLLPTDDCLAASVPQAVSFAVNLGSRVISHDFLYIYPYVGTPTLLLNRAFFTQFDPTSEVDIRSPE